MTDAAPPVPSFELQIEGMHCGSCVRRVTQAFKAIPGVECDVEIGKVTGRFLGAEKPLADLEAVVARLGFKVVGAATHQAGERG